MTTTMTRALALILLCALSTTVYGQTPPTRAAHGIQIENIEDKRTAALIEEIAKSSAAVGTENRKIADLYNSYMNEAAIEVRGAAPLRPYLDAINAIGDKRELARALGRSLRADVDPLNAGNFHTGNLFGLWVAPGFDDPTHYHAYMMQGGIQLGDRAFYTSDSQRSERRGSRRHGGRVRCVSHVIAREAGADGEWLHRRSAILHSICAELGDERAPRGAASDDHDEHPRAWAVSSARSSQR